MKDLWHIIYISRATFLLRDADLVDILEVSRRKNAERAITGMLLHSEGSFIQVLEGVHEDIREVFHHISRDERHTEITVLAEREIPQRDFPDWTMGFETIDRGEIAQRVGQNDFLTGEEDLNACFRLRRSLAHSLLLTFRNSTSLRRGSHSA